MNIKLSGGKQLAARRKALVMGILNSTPDSFFPESRKMGVEAGLAAAKKMVSEGADIIDIGGESTRPGSRYVEADEELRRVVPLIKAIRKTSDVAISVDTRKAVVAEEAVKAGADIINDVSALRDDPEIGLVAAKYEVPVVLMHMRGEPETMQTNPHYTNTIEEIISELEVCIDRAKSFGISPDKIITDPGIGFGKRLEDNLMILNNIDSFKALGYPLLIGLSRKSFLGKICNTEVEDRMVSSVVANMYSVMNGADIIRIHDIRETVQMLDIVSAVEGSGI